MAVSVWRRGDWMGKTQGYPEPQNMKKMYFDTQKFAVKDLEEKERAVDVINRAGKTDMFEQVVSSIPESDNRIKKMLEECDEKIKNRQLTVKTSKSTPKEISIDFDLNKYL